MLELVQAIRNGERGKLAELYKRNSGLLFRLAGRYRGIDNAVGLEDLMQAGFLGLVDAVGAWEPDRGAWSNIATLCAKKAMREAVGLRGSRPRAHMGAVSLDEPLLGKDGEEGDTRGDHLADESLPDMDERLLREDVVQAIRAAIDALPDEQQRGAFRMHRLKGITRKETAAAMGISESRVYLLCEKAERGLRRDERLRALAEIELLTPYHAHKGLTAFRSDFTSVVEAAVIWRERRRERLYGPSASSESEQAGRRELP